MKVLKTCALMALLTVCYLHSDAQESAPPLNEPDYNKPEVFADLPQKLDLRVINLEPLLNLSVGSQVSVPVAGNFQLVGTVVSKSNAVDASVKTIVIKSITRQGAVFTFTRLTKQDGSFSYSGRMISKDSRDALEIAIEGSNYVIRKKQYYDFVNE